MKVSRGPTGSICMPIYRRHFWTQGLIVFFISCVLIFTLISCNTQGETSQENEGPVFQFSILSKDFTDSASGLGYDWQSIWPILQSAYPTKVSIGINEYDIEHYDWTAQVITLSLTASESLLQKFNFTIEDCENKKNGRECLLNRAFIVSHNGVPLYGGIFIPDYPAPIKREYPIIYPALSREGCVTLTLRPYKSVSKRYQPEDYKLYNDQEWALIKDPNLKDLFEHLGKLSR